METQKICLGCFRELEKDAACCPRCGWEPDKTYEAVFDWKQGQVFEKRYLLGGLYKRTEHMAVWRIYDHVLGISCLILREEAGTKESLYQVATRLKKGEGLIESSIRLLTIKTLEEKQVLLFSMDPVEGREEALEAVLMAKDREQEEISEEDEHLLEIPEGASKEEHALPPGTLLGERYQILDCIGIGGFGIVYLCNDRYLRRLAAVKEYFPEEWALREEPYVDVKSSLYLEAFRFGLQSFEKEAKIQSQLLYTPHVAGIYDLFEENDTMYLVMEYISGVSIGREMRAREYRPYSPKEMAEILVPVMEALAVIHEKRIVHSDISPGNIMRAADGEIYLIDMGAAKYTLDSQPALSAAFLKIDYAAPEQYRTAKEGIPKDEGPWTDIYSLGATMYYLLTGQKPVDVVTRLGSKKPGVVLPRKCKCPNRKKWEKLINHACELEIGKRISSVEELSRQVSDLARES